MAENINKQKKYIIVAPPFNNGKSNGIKSLYFLSLELNKRGYETFIYTYDTFDERFKTIENVSKEMQDNDIVVYPEIIKGNPLEFKNVVRWVLYYPGIIGGETKYNENETIFTYRTEYYNSKNILRVPCLEENLFYKDNTPKNKMCYFVHKGGKWKEIPEFKDYTEITMSYPKERRDLANLLRKTKVLYSYDDHTFLLEEAYKCGCHVKIIRENGFEDYISDYEKEYAECNDMINNFINITQKINCNKKQKSILPKSTKIFYKICFHLYKFLKIRKKYERYWNKYICFKT